MILRLGIILALENIFDYEDFKVKCEAAGKPLLPIGEYAQKVGMLKVAMRQYGGLDPQAAYMKFISDMNEATDLAVAESKANPHKGCGGCGGGKKEAGGQLR